MVANPHLPTTLNPARKSIAPLPARSGGTGLNSNTIIASGLANNTALILPRWRAAIGKVLSGTGNVTVLAMGDSQSQGSFGANNSVQNDVNNYKNSWQSRLAGMFNTNGINANIDNFLGGANGDRNATDARITVTGGFGYFGSSIFVPGGQLYNSTATGTLNFTPDNNADTFVIYYPTNSGLGSFSYGIDGGSATTQSQNGTAALSSVTISTTLGKHTVNINWVSGSAYIIGIKAYDSSKSQISIYNSGSGGATTTNWLSSSQPYSALTGSQTLAPDLVVLELGQNDLIAGVSVGAAIANLQTIVNAMTATSDIVLINQIPLSTDGSHPPILTQNAWSLAVKAFAAKNNIPVVNIYDRWVSEAYSQPLGIYGGSGINYVHPNGAGYVDYAKAIFDVIGSNGGMGRPPISLQQTLITPADFAVAASTTLAAAGQLNAVVEAGATYQFKATLFVTPDATGGEKYAINGTATATSVIYQVNAINNTSNTNSINSKQTSLGGAAGVVGTNTSSFVTIDGSIKVNAAGTLSVYFAQNVGSGTSTLLKGSTFAVTRIS